MSYKYLIGDLNLLSEIRIPFLKTNNFIKPDVEVILKTAINPPKNKFDVLDDGRVLFKDKHANIFLIESSKIFISLNGNNVKEAANSLVGLPLGFLLQNNDFQVIHGSSVASDKLAICFVGMSAIGKSSIALSLVNHGLNLVTEDLCIIKNSHIYNFSNWIKSAPDSLLRRLEPLEEISVKNDSRNRIFYKLANKLVSGAITPLKAVYFLNNSKRTEIKKIKKSDAFEYLFTYSYHKNEPDIKSFKKLTRILEDSDFFLFSRDLNKPLSENIKFLINHLNEKMPKLLDIG